MLPGLTGLCRQIVMLEPILGLDSYGEPTGTFDPGAFDLGAFDTAYGAPVTYRARVVGKRQLVRNPLGEQVLSRHTVYFAANPVIRARDRITLSTGDVKSTETGAIHPPILSVNKARDDLGRVSTVVYLA